MISLTELELKDFLSHQNTKFPLSNQGLVLICGKSGAGKSSLADGILFALYGLTARGLKADSVIRVGQSGCQVTVRGDKDGAEFEITRQRGPASLAFRINGIDQSGASIKDTQAKIESFLGVDYQTFVSTIVFPQRTLGLASLPASEQREILGQILDLDRFEEAFERVKAYRTTVNNELVALTQSVERLKSSLDSEEAHLKQLKAAEIDFENDKVLRIKKLEAELDKASNLRLPEFNSNELNALEDTDPFYANQRILAEQGLADKKHTQSLVELAKAKATAQANLRALREPQDQSESVCGTCGQELPEVAVQRVQEASRQALVDYLAQKSAYENQIQEIKEAERNLLAQKAFIDQQISDKAKEIKSVVQRLTELRGIQRQHQDQESKILSLKAAIEEEQSRSWTGLLAIKETKAKIKECKKAIPEVEENAAKMAQELEYVDFWHSGFGNQGIRHFYLATITPYLSERASYYLSQLTDGQGQVQISTQRETKQGNYTEAINIETTVGNAGTFEGASGGEKQRISIALLFALSELMSSRAKVKVNLLFMDEPFESLGAEDVSQVVALLRQELGQYKDSVFVITHNETLAAEFESAVIVTKENDISSIHKN